MILLVEDETGIREALCAFLRIRGYEVLGAASHQEARHALSAGTAQVLITDIDLGDGDGRDLVDEARLKTPGFPSLILTARRSESLEKWLEEREGVTILQKPIRPLHLVAWLESRALQPKTDARPCSGLDALSVEDGELSRQVLSWLYAGSGLPPVDRAWREGDRLRLCISASSRRHRLTSLPRLARETLLALDLDLWPGQAGSEEISFRVRTRAGEKSEDLAAFGSTPRGHLIEKVHKDELSAPPESLPMQERRLLWPDLGQPEVDARCKAVQEP